MFQKLVNKLNDLRPRQLMILAVAAATLMFLTVYFSMSLLTKEKIIVQPAEEQPPPPPEVTKTAVVVAKTTIMPRTRIQDTMIQMKELPDDLVPEGAIKSFDDVLNVQVKVTIFSGDVLTIQKVFADKSAEGFIGTIPPDCRAVSINVNEITGVAGFARPGDFVDLLLSERSDYSATTSIILQNVPLLSVNQDMGNGMLDGNNGGSAISNPTIATFALRPDDALKLISASKLGEIYMSLRPAHPYSNYVDTVEYTIESVNSPYRAQPAQEVPAIPAEQPIPQMPAVPDEPPVPKIEIIQGDEIVQKAEEAPVVTTPATGATRSPSGVNPPLPVIPSHQPAQRNPFENSPASAALDSLPLSKARAITGG